MLQKGTSMIIKYNDDLYEQQMPGAKTKQQQLYLLTDVRAILLVNWVMV